jgi:hypothetical protein
MDVNKIQSQGGDADRGEHCQPINVNSANWRKSPIIMKYFGGGRRMNKKINVILALLIAASLVLAACGASGPAECTDELGCVD